MPRCHVHATVNYNRAFALGVGLNVIYILIEVGYGLAVGSLALLADAGHNMGDVLGLLLAWGGHYLAQLKPTRRHTYGWHSSTILAALFNALILMVAVGAIASEAIQRFWHPVNVSGTTIMAVAAIGVVINALTAMLFFKGRHQDLNLRGAFLHMAADAGVSLGVVIAGLLTTLYGWAWTDPVVSLIISTVIFVGTWGLLKESVNLAMNAVPMGIDPVEVERFLAKLPGVVEVHDLHVWGLSTTETALTAHLVMPEVTDPDACLLDITAQLSSQLGIGHATLQIERSETIACPHKRSDII